MSKYDIQPQFECQNRTERKNTIFGSSSNVKIGFLMFKYDIRSFFECRIRILNFKIRYSHKFECKNRILNVKILYSVLF